MDYVREHIHQYWGLAYKRTLGVAMVTFSVALAMGLTFTALTGNLAITSYSSYLAFWGILIAITAIIFLSNFFSAHISTIRFMSEEEHKSHSRYMGIWMISIVLGVLAFLLPLLFANSLLEPLILLFTFGGVFWILFLTVRVIFGHAFGELALGGVAFWFMLVFALYEVYNTRLTYISESYFTLYFAAMSITVISGFVGLALIVNASRESLKEFTSTVEEIERDVKRKRLRSKRKR